MKKAIYILTIVFCFSTSAIAQQEIKLKINHLLADQAFQFNTEAVNNISQTFDVIRMQYYLSDFRIIHDGGQETVLPDAYVLANPEDTDAYTLGEANFANIESIVFRIGVDSLNNHGDPSTWPADHPLAPKNPSTHWGWASGYRFVMMEGNGGISSADYVFEIHGLGDQHYKGLVSVNVYPVDEGTYSLIEINADYAGALNNINVSSGLINHGFDEEAAYIISNMKNHVFSEVELPTGVNIIEADLMSMNVSPNPAVGKKISYSYNVETHKNLKLVLSDINGKIINNRQLNSNEGTGFLSVKETGNYLLLLLSDEKILSSIKILVD